MATLKAQVESYLAQPKDPKPLQLVYQTSPNWPFQASGPLNSTDLTQIGVLDSSFNPPQRAHFALVGCKRPAFLDDREAEKKDAFDAILLLFSVRNADKGTGSNKDASTLDRLAMMECLAKDLEREKKSNVAIGIIEEPLMISKSTLVHEYIQQSALANGDAEQRVQDKHHLCARLHWLVGFDTLERFFQVKYYPSPEFFAEACSKFFERERTTFVCARRGITSLPNKEKQEGEDEQEQERKLLNSDVVAPWVTRGSIVMMDLEPSVQSISSTAVRRIFTNSTRTIEQTKTQLAKMTTSSVCEYLLREEVYTPEEERQQ